MNPHIILALLHLVLIVPFLLYIGLVREQVPESVLKGVLALGVIVLFYQSYKAYTKIIDGKSPWINYIHIFLLSPLLLIIGYHGKNTNRKYFEMLLMFAFAAGGYHSLSIMREIASR
jgi:hypothetical protein